MPECSVKAGDLTAVSGQSAVEALTTGTPSLGIVGCRHFNLMGFTNKCATIPRITPVSDNDGQKPRYRAKSAFHPFLNILHIPRAVEHPLFCNFHQLSLPVIFPLPNLLVGCIGLTLVLSKRPNFKRLNL